MHPNWPLCWPAAWRDPAALDLLKETPPGFLIFSSFAGYQNVAENARASGIAVCEIGSPPAGVEIVKGEWPGIRMTPGQGDASSGPTGAPWIDSNGWLIRLTRAQKPGRTIWIVADLPKANEVVELSRHLIAVTDAAVHGGCWAVTLDNDFAISLAARKPEARARWRKLVDAINFFEARPGWGAWPVDGTLAVVSGFSGANEFFSREMLNLMARTSISYSIVPAEGVRPESLKNLRAALYPDPGTPASEVRQTLLNFAENGGVLILRSPWPNVPFGLPAGESHPRYEIRRFGKGRIATARQQPDDPYEMAQDAQILLSHRYDRVRFFNGFLLGAYATASPDRKQRRVHMINYGGGSGDDPVTARLVGHFRSAGMASFEIARRESLQVVAQREGSELHLPRFDVYAGIELEV